MIGRGFDRHLLGLRLLLRPLNGEDAALFGDDLFDRSAQWKLSTSGLSAGLLFKGTGFGAMYEDGYGINCEFNVAARFSKPKIFIPQSFRSCCTKYGEIWHRIKILKLINLNPEV